jgi:carotenoid 1,2-hydratase
MPSAGLDFAAPVAPGGYTWWYVDALSDDGAYGLSIIAFIGSVFSPYYTLARSRARKRGISVDPRNHCAMNIALYGRQGSRWAMTERGRNQLDVTTHSLTIGPSSMAWDGTAMTIHFNEIAVPFPRKISGSLKIYPSALTHEVHCLNPDGMHVWWPMAPVSRVEVSLNEPSLRWKGHAYCDHNRGSAPIAEGFRSWTWCRASLQDGAAVFYDGIRKNNDLFAIGRQFMPSGETRVLDLPNPTRMRTSFWGIPRETRGQDGSTPKLVQTLEDTPFYARSSVAMRLADEEVTAVHESMSVDRFNTTLVQMMLPFRMPRRAG